MRRLLLLFVVVLIGLLLGALVAGRPETVPNDLRAEDIPPSTTTTTTTTPSTTSMSPTAISTTTAVTTPVPSREPSAPAGAIAPTSTVAVTATEAPGTTVAPSTTEPPTTTSTLASAQSVVVLVANASDTYGLATASAATLRDLGYVDVIRGDGLQERGSSVVYYVDGFEGEATRLAGQIGMPTSRIAPRPSGPLVRGQEEAEVLLLLGNDWESATNLTMA